MAQNQTDEKSLSEPMTSQFIDTYLEHRALTHWSRDKMAAIFQKTFLNAFSLTKIYKT